MTLQEYLDSKNLWNETALAAECVANMVYVKTSVKYPGLVLLHYADEASYSRGWNEFNCMCRGAILDMRSKQVIAWPFSKFFNLGEHTSTLEAVMAKGEFVATEKLDGSMLILFTYEGKNYFTTKGSFDSDHAEYANSIMPECIKTMTLKPGYTLMFELIAEKFRNVINYKKLGYPDGVYLIGERFPSGEYAKADFMTWWAGQFGLPVFKTLDFTDLKKTVEHCATLPSHEEGYVLAFDNGQFLVKVKGKDYLVAHKIMKGMNYSALIEALKTDKKQEIVMYCPEEYRDEVIAKFDFFEYLISKEYNSIDIAFAMIRERNVSPNRKDFAIRVHTNVLKEYQKFMFKLLDSTPKTEIYKMLCAFIEDKYIKDGQSVKSCQWVTDYLSSNKLEILICQ